MFEVFVYAVADYVRRGAVGVSADGGVDYDAGSGGVCDGTGTDVGQGIGRVGGVFRGVWGVLILLKLWLYAGVVGWLCCRWEQRELRR